MEGGTVIPAGSGRRKRGSGALAGGRWTQFAVRGLIIAVLLVLVLNGVYRLAGLSINNSGSTTVGEKYPTAVASGYALRFATAYLNWDQDHKDFRTEQLSVFFPGANNTQFGWDGNGVQRVLGAPVPMGVRAVNDKTGTVTVSAYIDPGGWTCMDVGVYSPDLGRSVAITSYTAFVACPTVAGQAVEDYRGADLDTQLVGELNGSLPAFFRAYAASSADLKQQVTNESRITGLRNTVQLGAIKGIYAPKVSEGTAGADKRTVTVDITWKTAGKGLIQQTYALDVVKQGDHWFVAGIRGGVPSPDVAPGRPGVAPPVSPDPFVTLTPSAPAAGENDPSASPSGASPSGGTPSSTPTPRPTPTGS